MSDRFHIHFTPDYSSVKLEKGVHPFKYMNKPLSRLHQTLRAFVPHPPVVLTRSIVLSPQVWRPQLSGTGSANWAKGSIPSGSHPTAVPGWHSHASGPWHGSASTVETW
jgi:hypothetical protein